MADISKIKLPNEAEARTIKDTEARNIANSKAADAVFVPADPTATPPIDPLRGLVPAPPSTPGTTKFLREDATWAEPAGVTDYTQLTNKPQINSVTLTGNLSAADLSLQKEITIDVDGTATAIADSNNSTEFLAGSNVTITGDTINGTITIAATDTTYESKQAASGGTDVSLVTTGEKYLWSDKQTGITMDIPDPEHSEQTVTTRIIDGNKNTKFIAGSNVALTPDTTNGTITFSATDTTYTDFGGSGQDHAAGLVPDPGATAGTSKFLCEDGSWAEPAGGFDPTEAQLDAINSGINDDLVGSYNANIQHLYDIGFANCINTYKFTCVGSEVTSDSISVFLPEDLGLRNLPEAAYIFVNTKQGTTLADPDLTTAEGASWTNQLTGSFKLRLNCFITTPFTEGNGPYLRVRRQNSSVDLIHVDIAKQENPSQPTLYEVDYEALPGDTIAIIFNPTQDDTNISAIGFNLMQYASEFTVTQYSEYFSLDFKEELEARISADENDIKFLADKYGKNLVDLTGCTISTSDTGTVTYTQEGNIFYLSGENTGSSDYTISITYSDRYYPASGIPCVLSGGISSDITLTVRDAAGHTATDAGEDDFGDVKGAPVTLMSYGDFITFTITIAPGTVLANDAVRIMICTANIWKYTHTFVQPGMGSGSTYTPGTGIDIATGDVINNTGVLNVTTDNTDTDASNGTVTITKLNAAGTATEEVSVPVKGLAGAAYKAVDTTITTDTQSENLPTSKAVDTYVQSAISELTGPMTFKGGATITADSTDTTKCSIAVTNPASSSSIKKGFTYKITSIAASPEYTGTLKVGDTLIADKNSPKVDATWTADTDWTVIPSGDEEGKTYPCFTYIEETEDEETVRYIGIDYGNL